jgi:hypothetical protein
MVYLVLAYAAATAAIGGYAVSLALRLQRAASGLRIAEERRQGR